VFGSCFLGLQLWKRLELDRFFEQHVDSESADVPWSRTLARSATHSARLTESSRDGGGV